jgi:hypothetical protein
MIYQAKSLFEGLQTRRATEDPFELGVHLVLYLLHPLDLDEGKVGSFV